MELIKWRTVNRKRKKDIRYSDAEYVRGYDLDVVDFSNLAYKFNTGTLLPAEERRLTDHVLTMISIVTSNPKITYFDGEFDALTDAMFIDCWAALKNLKEGVSPYSYMYRVGYMAAWHHFKKTMKSKEKAEAIEKHLRECVEEWAAESRNPKTPVHCIH